MAQRRMFSKKITDTDLFLDMPLSTQALYFHLNMSADDDGFVDKPKKIMKSISCTDDDMKILLSKQFIIPFDSGICVIKHWKLHNYIQKDRYQETMYKDEKKQLEQAENGAYEKCIQNGYMLDTQVRLGKDRLGKSNIYTPPFEKIKNLFNSICTDLPNIKVLNNNRKTLIKNRETTLRKFEVDWEKYFILVSSNDFLNGGNERNWKADFDWLLKESNMIKVLEGRYKSKKEKEVKTTNNKFLNYDEPDMDFDKIEQIEQEYLQRKLKKIKEGNYE